ncbi:MULTISPECIES: hypothetical protein [Hyphobacterium]|uniref:Uncharacterized protein n=1 Tax=Hyphobacterium vulgare TaxID=1736751 RepID=A0ABV6ZTJ7_9PROT
MMLTTLILLAAIQTAPDGCAVTASDGMPPDMRRPNGVQQWNDWASSRVAQGWMAQTVERAATEDDAEVIAAVRAAYEAEHGRQPDPVFDPRRAWFDAEGDETFVLFVAPQGCAAGPAPDYVAALIDGETSEVREITGDVVIVRGSYRPVRLTGGARTQ